MSVQLDYLPVLEDVGPAPAAEGRPLLIPLALIDEDPAQPRSEFAADALAELAATIAARGVRQPVSVRPHPETQGRWMLNFGARRLRASRLAGKAEIPAFVDEMPDSYDQVIENEQREALRPMELALFVKRQLAAGQSQSDVARELGKSPTYITFVSALIDPPDWLIEVYRAGKCRGVTELYELRRTHAEQPEAVMELIREREFVSRADIARLRERLVASRPTAPALGATQDNRGEGVVSQAYGSGLATAALPAACRNDPPRRASPRHDRLAVLAQAGGCAVEVALDDLPFAADEVFVVDESGKNRRAVKLSEVHGLRLLRG